jgi:glycosyltransferase involved in cell wall biosynthesis
LAASDRVIANSNYTAELAEQLGAGENKAEVVHPGLDVPKIDLVREEAVMEELSKKYWFVRTVTPPSRAARVFPSRRESNEFPSGLDRREAPEEDSPWKGVAQGWGKTPRAPQIVFSLGRLVRRKGCDMMIKAWPMVKEACPEAVYAIGGSGPDEAYLKKIIAKLPENIRESVVFLGAVSDEEKWVWLRLADLFAQPAREEDGDVEGFGIVYLEANARGRAVLAGDSGGVRDAVEEEETGLLCDPELEDDIAEKVIYLLQRPEERRRMGEEGMMRAVTRFNAKRQGERLYNILNK